MHLTQTQIVILVIVALFLFGFCWRRSGIETRNERFMDYGYYPAITPSLNSQFAEYEPNMYESTRETNYVFAKNGSVYKTDQHPVVTTGNSGCIPFGCPSSYGENRKCWRC